MALTDLLAAALIDPAASAEAAGLRYVTDALPGIRRRRAGKDFRYTGPAGTPVRDAATLGRIKALAIPPAWTGVWICPDPRGHLQATGRDARGRKQYRYHPHWRSVRDSVKYDRLIAFADALPRIRRRVEEDLRRPGLPREKVLAAVVRLLETTRLRIGNDEYRRHNHSFGLTTLRDRHVDVGAASLRFHFRGKSGKVHDVRVGDRRLARIVKRCRDIPGQELFQYLDDAGDRHSVESGDVNAYLRDVSGEAFTAKDYRTWSGTVLALRYFRACGPSETKAEAKRQVVRAVERVAEHLGNTVAVCRKCYVHPAVVEAYLAGTLAARSTAPSEQSHDLSHDLSEEERAVLDLLRSTKQTAAAVAAISAGAQRAA